MSNPRVAQTEPSPEPGHPSPTAPSPSPTRTSLAARGNAPRLEAGQQEAEAAAWAARGSRGDTHIAFIHTPIRPPARPRSPNPHALARPAVNRARRHWRWLLRRLESAVKRARVGCALHERFGAFLPLPPSGSQEEGQAPGRRCCGYLRSACCGCLVGARAFLRLAPGARRGLLKLVTALLRAHGCARLLELLAAFGFGAATTVSFDQILENLARILAGAE